MLKLYYNLKAKLNKKQVVQMKKSQGSAHVVIIVILVVALLGALGFIFWQNFIHKASTSSDMTTASTTQNTQTSTTAGTSSTSSTSSSSPTTLTADDANQLVQKTYSRYISNRKAGESVADSLEAIKSNFTDTAYAKLTQSTDQEALTCASNYIPDSVTLVTSLDGSTATSSVTRIMDGQTASAKIQVTTDASAGKISAVSCPS